MNENALAQILSAAIGRPVNAAPSVANGGVAYRPTMQSSAPNNFMSMLLGALIGGGGGGYAPQMPTYAPQPTQRIPTFEEWMFQRTGGVIPTTDWRPNNNPEGTNMEWVYGADGQLKQRRAPGIAGQVMTPWGSNTSYNADNIEPGSAGTKPITQEMIDQYNAQTRPTVPQTGPTVNGKTYYPSPIPGSQNPQTPGGTTPMMPMVQPYQRGSWQMPQLPQMWNPYGFGGFGGFGGYRPPLLRAHQQQQPQVSGLSLFGGYKQPSMNSMSYFGGDR